MRVIVPVFLVIYVLLKGEAEKSPGFGAERIGWWLWSWSSTCIGCAEIDKNKCLSECQGDKI